MSSCNKPASSGHACGPAAVALVSLGCAKNLVESETMLGQLAQAGFLVTGDYSAADVIVVNTCGFLQAAQQEATEVICELEQYKRIGSCRALILAGCWAQLGGEALLERFPFVDAVIGVNDRHCLAEAIVQCLEGRRLVTANAYGRRRALSADVGRLRLTPRHWAYLRISEGCSQKCSFCSIPAIRGPYRDKPMSAVLAEARELIASGARELVLIGQETTSYGSGSKRGGGLARLLRALDRLEGVDWIRLMYTYPANFADSTIRAIAECRHVVKYVDLPLQHISDRILRAMGRRIGRAETEALLEKLRRAVPGIAIRTTMLVGFPGETDRQFEELLDFVRQFKFDALGAFAFSPEPGTRAAAMADQVPEQEKLRRLDALMRLQRRIAGQLGRQRIGSEFDVYVEPSESNRSRYLRARSAFQAPEVDPVTLIHRATSTERKTVPVGTKLRVKCTGVRGYDLIAEPVDSEAT